jgi:DNA-binding transcriptional LysR family regulator
VNVTDSFGDITLVLPPGATTYRVSARTSFGTTTVSVPQAPAATSVISDDRAPELVSSPLLTGRAVVCMRPDSPLAGRDRVRVSDLLSEPLIVMRAGYLMHRYVHRLLQGRVPSFPYATDGAEMGKLMAAEGLGVSVLPDFSVIGDPLEQRGIITWRPIADDHTQVQLVIQRIRSGSPPLAARDLYGIFVERARAYPLPAAPLTAVCR